MADNLILHHKEAWQHSHSTQQTQLRTRQQFIKDIVYQYCVMILCVLHAGSKLKQQLIVYYLRRAKISHTEYMECFKTRNYISILRYFDLLVIAI